MDMKKILQAMDGISTKPVEGADSMAKFLRMVKEADLNTAAPAMQDSPSSSTIDAPPELLKQIGPWMAKKSLPNLTPVKAPPMPTGQLQSGEKLTTNPDGTVSYASGQGTYTYDKAGKPLKYTSPSFAGLTQTNDLVSGNIAVRYLAGPLDATANFDKKGKSLDSQKVQYDLGPIVVGHEKDKGITTNTVQDRGMNIIQSRDMVKDPAAYDRAMAQVNNTPVQENSLSKFLSIVNKNNVSMLKEGATPHKVALPVQMAMQHYQHTAETKQPRERLIDKYFVEAETEIMQRREEKRSLINQYAKTIAERVLMKESKLDEKSVSPKQARTMAAAAHDPEFAKRVGIKQSVAKEFNKADTGTKQLSQAMKAKKKVNEAPIAMDPSEPNNPTVHGHDKANSMSLKGRIMSARAQLKELAQLAESDNLLVWEEICKKAKGGMFMGLEQNLEQIRHGISELAVKRRKGGVSSKGIDKHIGEGSKK